MLHQQSLFADKGLFAWDNEIRALLQAALDKMLPQTFNMLLSAAAEDYARASTETSHMDKRAKMRAWSSFRNVMTLGGHLSGREKKIWKRIARIMQAKAVGDIYLKLNEIKTNKDVKEALRHFFSYEEVNDRFSFKYAFIHRMFICYHYTLNDQEIIAQTNHEAAYLIDMTSQVLGLSFHDVKVLSEKVLQEQEEVADNLFSL